jgi:acetyl-CoA acetyltransferase
VNAAAAHAQGLYADEVVAAHGTTLENCVKADSNAATLATLKPAFVKPHGTITAATSSPLTDGASAVREGEQTRGRLRTAGARDGAVVRWP